MHPIYAQPTAQPQQSPEVVAPFRATAFGPMRRIVEQLEELDHAPLGREGPLRTNIASTLLAIRMTQTSARNAHARETVHEPVDLIRLGLV